MRLLVTLLTVCLVSCSLEKDSEQISRFSGAWESDYSTGEYGGISFSNYQMEIDSSGQGRFLTLDERELRNYPRRYSDSRAWFELSGNTVRVYVSGSILRIIQTQGSGLVGYHRKNQPGPVPGTHIASWTSEDGRIVDMSKPGLISFTFPGTPEETFEVTMETETSGFYTTSPTSFPNHFSFILVPGGMEFYDTGWARFMKMIP